MAKRQMKDKESAEWARRLGQALEDWRKTVGLQPVQLARLLGIGKDRLYAIRAAVNLSSKISEYAKIYLWTGLSEADPTKIPPMLLTRKGKPARKKRAWSQSQFDNWLKSPAAQTLLTKKEKGDTSPLPEVERTMPTSAVQIYEHVMALVEHVSEIIAEQTARKVAHEVLARIMPPPRNLSKALFQELLPMVMKGDMKAIERWLDANPDAAKVLVILDAITSGDVKSVLPLIATQLRSE